MLERSEERFGLKPHRLAAEAAYGSAPTLNWLVEDKQLTPHISIIDKSNREDGTFSRSDFRYDAERDAYDCPTGKELRTRGTVHEGTTLLYRASKLDCDQCSLLPEGTSTKDPSQRSRPRPRRCPIARRHRSIRAVAARPQG